MADLNFVRGSEPTDSRETRAIALGAAVVFAYVAAVLMSGRVELRQFFSLLVPYLSGSLALWLVIGVVCFIGQLCWNAGKSGREAFLADYVSGLLAARWQRDRFASLLWPPILFAVLMASFNAFKQMVLPIAGYGFDPLLAQADRLLFFGQDGWRVTHAILGSVDATVVIDRFYHGWFVPMALGVILCAWLPARTYRLRTQYLLSYTGVWIIIGSVLAFLLPSAGPCFYTQLVGNSAEFNALTLRLAEIQATSGEPLMALRNQEVLLRAHGSDHLVVGGGISAMPSVHNGLAVLFALAAWQVNRPLGVVLAAYAAVIWVGSVHLGWHYALDGVVAAVLTLGIWKTSGRIADRLERPLLPPAAQPAVA
jgi:hypothetical protein